MKKLIIMAIGVLFIVSPALADYGTVDVAYDGTVGTSVFIDLAPAGAVYKTVGAGEVKLELSGSTYPLLSNGFAKAFCLDLYDYSSYGAHEYRIVDLDESPITQNAGAISPTNMGVTAAQNLGALLNNNWKDAVLVNGIQKAALQLAVWEVVYDTPSGYDLTAGAFQAWSTNDSIEGAAQGMLDNIGTGLTDYNKYYLALASEASIYGSGPVGLYQDWVVRVPAPSAFLLAMLGFGVAAKKLRQRKLA